MAKITVVIDIGSNSVRMIAVKKSSRFAFHVIYEAKSRVRISEGCYENGGKLQKKAIDRAIKALCDFKKIAQNLKARKILCVATSAVRDASNKNFFIKTVRDKIGLNIKVIDGRKEALLGGIAAMNLLPRFKNAVTIDIGGGSTELCKIENGKIVDTISIDMGTIRIKELFYDKNRDTEEIENFVQKLSADIGDNFKSENIIAIGGTARAISKLIMPKDYPLKTLHAYEYNFNEHEKLFEKISASSIEELKSYGVKKHRLDTFREGVAIFLNTLKILGAKRVITSGVGVREGVYLQDLLRSSSGKFPANFNPSYKSLCDRFLINESYANSVKKSSIKIFYTLKEIHNIEERYIEELSIASKLLSIGSSINYYNHNEHSFYLIINSLNYGYTHSQKLLIAFITLYQNKKLPKESELKEYLSLLPDLKKVKWLSFILSLSKCLHKNIEKCDYDFSFENNTLFIKSSKKKNYLSQECIKELFKPFPIAIILL